MGNVKIGENEYYFDAAVLLMDDEIREALHALMTPCSDQEFMDAYILAHAEKFNGEAFSV